jgi:hypothetical protein
MSSKIIYLITSKKVYKIKSKKILSLPKQLDKCFCELFTIIGNNEQNFSGCKKSDCKYNFINDINK